MTAEIALRVVKVVHTIAWAFFSLCILAIPIEAWLGRFDRAAVLIAVVLVEVLLLTLNAGDCPLRNVAARYTEDRRDGFDIYLPGWVVRENKRICGPLLIAGMIFTSIVWWMSRT